MARRAFLEGGNANLGLGPARGIFESELEVVAQIGTTIHAVAAAAALRAEDLAEYVAECIGEAAEAFRARAAESPRAGEACRRIDTGVTELVVRRALLRVGQDLVGLLRFLEFFFRPLVGIAVRVMLHRELAVGLLDVLLGSIAVDAQHRVVVPLCHQVPCQLSSSPSTKRTAPPLQASRPVRVNRRRRRRFNADRNYVAQPSVQNEFASLRRNFTSSHPSLP